LSDLAKAKPAEIRAVLVGEIAAELAALEPRPRYDLLEDISNADERVIELVTPALLGELERRLDLPNAALVVMLRIISRGIREDRAAFTQLAINRFNSNYNAEISALYLAASFAVDPAVATTALTEKLVGLSSAEQTALVERFLPRVFGGGISYIDFSSEKLPFDRLERVVHISFRTIRVDEDRDRSSGVAFTPDERDNAEQARGAAFNQLAGTPGRATFDALLRLADRPECAIAASWMRDVARDRAAEDSESAPWPPGEAVAFEKSRETAPRTARDLQLVALRRLADIQHELLHGDFAQGATLSSLPDETAVQNWVADRLRLKQGSSYSVEREPHVVDEKEPDVRFRAKATDASVAMEIKLVGSWSLRELEAALSDQLCGRYLRARDARHGILLLVCQRARPRGWEDPRACAFLNFDQVVKHLQSLAARIAGDAPDAPQPEIAVLDVAGCTTNGK
jgi:hypothetical protein